LSESSDSRDLLLNRLADEFAARRRAGERPELDDYCAHHPDLAADIRDLFPALVELEQAREDAAPDPPAGPAAPPVTSLGDFRLIREVGRGGMGVVYEAEQLSLGRRVALKLLPAGVFWDPVKRRRFEREAKAAAKLHHTNIVPVHGYGEHAGTPYYVMQFIPGLGLDAVIDELALQAGRPPDPDATPTRERAALSAALAHSLVDADGAATATRAGGDTPASPAHPGRGPAVSPGSSGVVHLPGQSGAGSSGAARKAVTYWESVARIGAQVAGALAYAHKLGVLHRDIKPGNLLLDLDGVVWVTDFGLAKADDSDDLTHTGDLLGTLRYMPPEAFDGLYDARGDVYSLGLTLYELVALRPAYTETERNKLVKQVTTGEPPPLDALRRDAPRDLVTIVQKAVAREPARRYASAADLGADLQRFLDDEPILARRQTRAERFVRWARRNPGIAALGGTLAAVLLLATAASLAAASHFNRLRLNERDARRDADVSRDAEAKERARADDNARTARGAEKDARTLAAAATAAKARADQEKQRADGNARTAGERAAAARVAEAFAKARQAEAEWLVYAGKLSLAQADFETGTGAHSLQYLRECAWDRRGWEHRHLWTRATATVTLGHASPVGTAAFSPDGKRVVTGTWEKPWAVVWDAETGRELFRLDHGVAVRGVAFSPDGKLVATAAGDLDLPGTAKVWDAASGLLLYTLAGHTGWVLSAAFSPDGTRILTAGGDPLHPGEAKVWDAATGKPLLTIRSAATRYRGAAFSPDGKRIVTAGGDGKVTVWDAATGGEMLILQGNAAEVTGAAFSPDGRRIVAGGFDRTGRIWDAETGDLLHTLKGHTGWVMGVAYSPDGTRVLTAGADATVRVWDAATGLEVLALKGHGDQVSAAAFSPDGGRIVSASVDRTARVWDAVGGQTVPALDAESGPVRGVAFGPDSRHVATGNRVWDAATGRPVYMLGVGGHGTGCVAYCPDGTRVVTCEENTATVRDAATGKELFALKGHTGAVLGVAYSRDGARIATAAYHQDSPGAVRVWDAATGREVLALDRLRARVWAVAFSRDGTRLVTADDKTARVWDAATGREVRVLAGHGHEVWSVAFSPDGTRIATGCLDRHVRVWDAATGRLVLTLKGHTQGVWAVAWGPDGKRLFSAGEDGAVRVWDAGKGQELLALKVPGPVYAVAVSGDGTRVAAGGEDGRVRVWVADKAQVPVTDDERAAVLKDRLPALLDGTEAPADDGERVALARYAFDRRRFAVAARLWAEVLDADPGRGDNRRPRYRHAAARAAARAAAGDGPDDPPDAAARARLRRRALDWLRAELAALAGRLDAGMPTDWAIVSYELADWKYDRDLAAVRDSAALDKLTADERAELARLWADAAALAKAVAARHGDALRGRLAEARKAPPGDSQALAYLLAQSGRVHGELGEWAEAERHLRECLALREKGAPDAWTTFNTYSALGGALAGQKRYAEAEPLLLKGYQGMRERVETIPHLGRTRVPEAIDRLIEFYTVTDRPDEVKKWRAEAANLPDPPPPPAEDP
jgi:WD40 repeat protein/serine/threonine protein kinase